MKKSLLFLGLLLFAVKLTSQELPKIVPPSPEASSLAKFIEMPVSHYTGMPNINIPIFTIQESGVTLPISLSYHAKGIQV